MTPLKAGHIEPLALTTERFWVFCSDWLKLLMVFPILV
jgi:hypothetical protein